MEFDLKDLFPSAQHHSQILVNISGGQRRNLTIAIKKQTLNKKSEKISLLRSLLSSEKNKVLLLEAFIEDRRDRLCITGGKG